VFTASIIRARSAGTFYQPIRRKIPESSVLGTRRHKNLTSHVQHSDFSVETHHCLCPMATVAKHIIQCVYLSCRTCFSPCLIRKLASFMSILDRQAKELPGRFLTRPYPTISTTTASLEFIATRVDTVRTSSFFRIARTAHPYNQAWQTWAVI
jgi:hypothetical protein